QVQILEAIREELQPFYSERIKEIPKVMINYVEKIKEVNHIVRNEGPVESSTVSHWAQPLVPTEPVATTAGYASPLSTPLVVAAASADATTQDARYDRGVDIR
ncbi:unnamed protein product, partial [Prorocentrum cordatum]